MTMKHGVLMLAASAALLAGVGFSYLFDQQTTADADIADVTGFQGYPLTPPRELLIPELYREDGQAFTLGDLRGHWSLVFFGYTHCPDICPTTMSVLAQARTKSVADFPQVYFVTVDPQRDTPEILQDYVRYFDTSFVGLTGEAAMLGALATQLSTVYMRAPAEAGSENEYLMDHSSAIMLINPQGQLAAFINSPHSAQSIQQALSKLVANH